MNHQPDAAELQAFAFRTLTPTTIPKVAIVARQLSIDFAQALTGFGRSGGRAVPTMEGILVCQEHAGVLTEAYTAWAQKQVEEAHKRKEKKLLKRWTILVRGITTQDRIRREYGPGAQG